MNKLRVFVGTKFENRTEARKVMSQLKDMGHDVYDWTLCEETDEGYPVQHAKDDIRAAAIADLYIALCDKPFWYQGTLVEIGVALAMGVPVWVIGHEIDACLFVHHPVVRRFETIEEALITLQ